MQKYILQMSRNLRRLWIHVEGGLASLQLVRALLARISVLRFQILCNIMFRFPRGFNRASERWLDGQDELVVDRRSNEALSTTLLSKPSSYLTMDVSLANSINNKVVTNVGSTRVHNSVCSKPIKLVLKTLFRL